MAGAARATVIVAKKMVMVSSASSRDSTSRARGGAIGQGTD
jgi:hypothetical protein